MYTLEGTCTKIIDYNPFNISLSSNRVIYAIPEIQNQNNDCEFFEKIPYIDKVKINIKTIF